jgi:predicted GIY-YIG superfamily endonuclease
MGDKTWTVYAIFCRLSSKYVYIGCTSDLAKRTIAHGFTTDCRFPNKHFGVISLMAGIHNKGLGMHRENQMILKHEATILNVLIPSEAAIDNYYKEILGVELEKAIRKIVDEIHSGIDYGDKAQKPLDALKSVREKI